MLSDGKSRFQRLQPGVVPYHPMVQFTEQYEPPAVIEDTLLVDRVTGTHFGILNWVRQLRHHRGPFPTRYSAHASQYGAVVLRLFSPAAWDMLRRVI